MVGYIGANVGNERGVITLLSTFGTKAITMQTKNQYLIHLLPEMIAIACNSPQIPESLKIIQHLFDLLDTSYKKNVFIYYSLLFLSISFIFILCFSFFLFCSFIYILLFLVE